ncbi:hypothetical protein NAPIS_ORF00271 [Vairimorpha apis BRL 01]|uniref:Uncharacterized protein n=1 Tax=Vairimorpha apis BRL 01 TaxID=1037528 RepID=T0LCX1_9MICR|nr:hypothetical protein NAPIS_ORF00271 [Vairimorpha apis BRL 01]
MANILLKLTEISTDFQEPKFITVDTNFTSDLIINYIQLLKDTNDCFTLYINNEVFNSTLEEAMEKYGLSIESQSQISFIKYNFYNKNLYIGFYEMPLKIYNKNKDYSFINVRTITFNSLHIFGYKFRMGIIDLNLEKVVDNNKNISLMLIDEDNYTTELIMDNLSYNFENVKISGIYKFKNKIFFVSLNGDIACNEFLDKKNYNITCVDSKDNETFFGTSTNVVYKYNKSGDIKYDVELRYINFIKIINENVIIIASQYVVQILRLDPFNVLKNYKFDNEISGLEAFDGKIYVSCDTKLFKFTI